MRFPVHTLRYLIAATFFVVGQPAAQDNQVKFRLSGGAPESGGSIPIKNGQPVTWDELGNLEITCTDDDTDGFCDGTVGKSGGSSEGAASLDHFRIVGGGTSRIIGEGDSLSFTLEWQGDITSDVCLSGLSVTPSGTAGATPTSWNERLNRTGTKLFTLGTSTVDDISYAFSMTCYNESGSDAATGTRTVNVTVEAREAPVLSDSCNITDGVGAGADPLFQPAGFTPHIVSWSQLFHYAGKPTTVWEYPQAWGEMYPVGSWTMGNIGLTPTTSLKGRYISVPFVADTQSRSTYFLEWWQPIYRNDFPLYTSPGSRLTERFFITISPCSGDFRRPTNSGNGPADGDALWSACRKEGNEDSIAYGKNYCKLVHGQTYYMNLLYADPAGGLSPTETNCSNSNGICDVMLYPR